MGGTGAGHKSERARAARLVNMAKARAARKREPLRWRSGVESRVIEQLVWQWWLSTSGEWLVARCRKTQVQIPRRRASRNDSRVGRKPVAGAFHGEAAFAESAQGKPAGRAASAGKPWPKVRVARLLGVSHTWVNKLVKRFEADPDRMRRRMAGLRPATLEKLERAREETRRQRELGWLRGPIRRRRVKWTLGGKTRRAVVWTQSEMRRWEEKAESRSRTLDAEIPAWARA